MTDITNTHLEAAIIDQMIAGMFRDQRYAFAPVIARSCDGWALGVVVEDEAGYAPVDGKTFADGDEARDWADGLNQHLGHSIHEAFAIITSSMRKGRVR